MGDSASASVDNELFGALHGCRDKDRQSKFGNHPRIRPNDFAVTSHADWNSWIVTKVNQRRRKLDDAFGLECDARRSRSE